MVERTETMTKTLLQQCAEDYRAGEADRTRIEKNWKIVQAQRERDAEAAENARKAADDERPGS
jgi:hypothetical protein